MHDFPIRTILLALILGLSTVDVDSMKLNAFRALKISFPGLVPQLVSALLRLHTRIHQVS